MFIITGPSTDSSDDEPLSKLVRKSPVTKTLMIVLERCINEVVLVNNFSVDLANTGKRSASKSPLLFHSILEVVQTTLLDRS